MSAARRLAELVLSMQMVTVRGLIAQDLARDVLYEDEEFSNAGTILITTNGTTRIVPADEPVFLIRGQDIVGGAAVRAWSVLAETAGADSSIVESARTHAAKMDAWKTKKVPDLPSAIDTRGKGPLGLD